MKHLKKYKYPIVFTLLSFVILISFQHCGSGGSVASNSTGKSSDPLTSNNCSNSIVNGKWNSTTEAGKNLIFSNDCQFINEFCKSSGTYPKNITNESGSALITVEVRANDAPVQCPSVGSTSCNYKINTAVTPNELDVICGNVWGTYTKDLQDSGIITEPILNEVNPASLGTSDVDQYGRVLLSTYRTSISNNGFRAALADSENYRFYNSTSGSSGSGCTTHSALGGWINYYTCSGSYGTSTATGSYDSVSVIHSTQDLTSKKNELLGIINQAQNYSNSSDRLRIYIQTINGDVYTIDFRVPMAANPVVKNIRATGVTRSLDYSFSGYGSLSSY